VPGTTGGEEAHALTEDELPRHSHTVAASDRGGQPSPVGNVPGTSDANQYAGTASAAFAAKAVSRTGGSQPHENRSPLLVLTFSIAYLGASPS
jgi:microcystin-dependent protein